MIFGTPAPEEPLSQADVFDACPIFGLEMSDQNTDLNAAPARWQERVIVLTQACDLAQTKTTKVLVALVHPAQLLVERGILKAQAIRDQIRRGQVYGWYYLPAAPVPHSAPGIDRRSPRLAHRPARPSGAPDCGRQTSLPVAFPLPRTPGAALCRHVHANRSASPFRD